MSGCALSPAVATAARPCVPSAPPQMPSAAIVQLMKSSWSADPARRPTFAAIKVQLDEALAALDES